MEVEARIRAALGDYQGDDWLERACDYVTQRRLMLESTKQWDCSSIGARIKTAREIAGMSQCQLALRINTAQWNVSGWERGTRDIPAKKFAGLCMSLGVSKEWLLMESEEGGPTPVRGILRRNQPEKLVKYRRKKQQLREARLEAARINAARRESVSALTRVPSLRQDSRQRPKKHTTQDPIVKKSEESGA